MTDLSMLANAFSVVGLADVVCRASIQLYDSIQGLRNAPARQKRYLGILRDLTLTATQVRLWVETHQRSISSVPQSQHELQGVSIILQASEDQIRQLRTSLTPSTTSTWLGRWRSVACFAWDEASFQDAFDLLEKNNNCLSILLQLCSIKNGIGLNREMKNMSSRFQELQNLLLSSDSTVRQDLCALRDQIELQTRNAPSNAEWQLLSQKIGESSKELRNLLDEQNLHYSNWDDALVRQADLQKYLLSALEDARRIPPLAMGGPAAIFAATQRIEADLVRWPAALEKLSHPNALFGVRNPHQVLLSLLLIRPRMISCIQMMAKEGGMHLSQREVSWVQSEFDLLQRLAAFLLADPTASEKDLRFYEHTFQHRSRNVKFRRKYADRTAGGLLITDSSVAYDGARDSQETTKFHDYRFACIANPPDCEPSGLLAAFHRKQDVMMARSPQITRSLRELTIVPEDSPICQYTAENNVDKMCEMFSKREASPFDYTQDGASLLAVAASNLNYEAIEFLLQQGADPLNCLLNESGVHDIWDVMTNGVPVRFIDGCLHEAAKKIRQTANLIPESGLDPPEDTTGPQIWIGVRVAACFDVEEARTVRVRSVEYSQCRDFKHDEHVWLPLIECVREVMHDVTRAEKGALIFMSSSESLLRPVLERFALCYSNAVDREFNTCIEYAPGDSVEMEITAAVVEDLAALEQEAREIGATLNCCDCTQWFVPELAEILKKGEVKCSGNQCI